MKTFKCAYCLVEKEEKEIGGETSKNVEKLTLQKEIWEQELAKITARQLSLTNSEKRAEIDKTITAKQKEIENIANQIKNSLEKICKSCWKRFEKKDYETFICIVCKLNITGKKLGGHIANYQDEGIQVRKWSEFCQSCKDTKITEANIYCPKKGDGRDDEWDVTKPLFDCDCPVPEEKQII